MKHSNISIFVPHAGCPQQCSFCNQKTISGAESQPSAEDVRRICSQALLEIKDRNNTEIAFFGGSFTAIDRAYMLELLTAAREFVGEKGFRGIRISTRPDFIDREILGILKENRVTAIELGAQSLSDRVLAANDRGHTAGDVFKASGLIREFGFELGLQVMVGLYGSTAEDEEITERAVRDIHPDTLRIYPVVVLKGTKLEGLYRSGEYRLFEFDQAVRLSTRLLKLEKQGIRVIKCGLHASEFVEKDMVAGFYHPAFRELCEGLIYRQLIEKALENRKVGGKCVIAVNDREVSKAIGQKKANILYFRNKGVDIKIVGGRTEKYQCEIKEDICI